MKNMALNLLTPVEFIILLDEAGIDHEPTQKPTQYLNSTEVAVHVGINRTSMTRLRLPPADITLGGSQGWTLETINAWNAARVSRPRKHRNT